jgi:hypothetical protein
MTFISNYCQSCGGETTQQFNTLTGVSTCVECGSQTENDERGSRDGNKTKIYVPLED